MDIYYKIFESFSIKEPKKKKDRNNRFNSNKTNENEVVLCLPVSIIDNNNKNV